MLIAGKAPASAIQTIKFIMIKKTTYYPDLAYPASQLSAYSRSMDLFVISLKTEEIIRFKPDDVTLFKLWLEKYGIRDINAE